MDALLTHQGETNTGEIIHSLFGTISTLFLFTRLWARTKRHHGLWWDDYLLIASWVLLLGGNGSAAALPSYGFRVLEGSERGWTLMKCSASFFYLAAGLGKAAFATTLARLSGGGTRALLRAIIVLVCAFSIAVAIVTWVAICGQDTDVTALTRTCVPQQAIIWIHTGNAIVTFCADFILAFVPWTILKTIDLPKREKIATGLSMSLVGLAGVVCVVRVAILAKVADLQEREGEVDWTYGSMMVWALAQSEVAIYIIAQTVPLLRVLLSQSSSQTHIARSIIEIDANNGGNMKGKGPATGRETNCATPDPYEGVEMLQLPSGRIVTADSAEGEAFKASQPASGAAAGATAPSAGQGLSAQAQPPTGEGSARVNDDKVHELWLSMGLSKRAWSQSPPPETG